MMKDAPPPRRRAWIEEEDISLDAFHAARTAAEADAQPTRAASAVGGIPVYDAESLRARAADRAGRRDLLAELAAVLLDGAGAFAIRGAYPDHAPLDAATAGFEAIIADQKAVGGGGGDHFARPGANDRIWNSLEKLCLRDPEAFADYYSNDMIALGCEAWLGPRYQIAAQVNCVNPGGDAQAPHRDYHLGFLGREDMTEYPAHVHRFSPQITLQGAIAHVDVTLDAGPTKLLPFSQVYEPGYLAAHRAEFKDYFEAHFVQVPLAKGDVAFFSPGLMHAAGANRTADLRRMVNLIQASSAFGCPMERIDRVAMCAALYPVLAAGGRAADVVERAIAAAADGYAFPTNLDLDPPVGGLAPKTQAALMREALAEGAGAETFAERLADHARRRESR